MAAKAGHAIYSPLRLAAKYLQYYMRSSNGKGHGMHSPFVYQFVRNVLMDKQSYPEYSTVETLRKKMLNDHSMLEIVDFGAGSAHSKSNTRSVSSIAKNAAKPKKLGQLLFRIARHYQVASILELGTSLGITTSYLALANRDARLSTLEGAPSIASVAAKNLDQAGAKNTEIIIGNFDETLAGVIDKRTFDLVFIDGNHRYEPTTRYFQQLLPALHNDSIMIFDDIHWSVEMEKAWKEISDHDAVRCTIDLFFIGIVLFRDEFKAKQHFEIRF